MKTHYDTAGPCWPATLLALTLTNLLCPAASRSADDLAAELKSVPHRIVYETWRDNNWELCAVNADGANPVNLTRTANVHELYPHVSADGKQISFVCDDGEGAAKVRNLYTANPDGSRRTLVAKNARDQCFSADAAAIAYLKGELEQFSYTDFATKGVFIADLATGQRTQHPNKDLHHLYNLCWSPDGNWFLATVHAGMGFSHAILAIEAKGTKVFDLKIPGCRPDISPDGKRVAWGASDWVLRVGDLDFAGPQPKVVNARDVVVSKEPMKVYHADWSPDGKYLAFARGPEKKRLGLVVEMVGVRAEEWDICVADVSKTNRWVQITHDGQSNKEPDWMPVAAEKKP